MVVESNQSPFIRPASVVGIFTTLATFGPGRVWSIFSRDPSAQITLEWGSISALVWKSRPSGYECCDPPAVHLWMWKKEKKLRLPSPHENICWIANFFLAAMLTVCSFYSFNTGLRDSIARENDCVKVSSRHIGDPIWVDQLCAEDPERLATLLATFGTRLRVATQVCCPANEERARGVECVVLGRATRVSRCLSHGYTLTKRVGLFLPSVPSR